jgi:hypothetical protein
METSSVNNRLLFNGGPLLNREGSAAILFVHACILIMSHCGIVSMHAAEVCFRLDDAHLRSGTCSQSRLDDVPCLPPCMTITTSRFS